MGWLIWPAVNLGSDLGSDRTHVRANHLVAGGSGIIKGQRYVVSMLGEHVQWVQNVRAAGGKAALRHGRREEVLLAEVPIDQRATIIKTYLQRAPGARPHVPVHKDAPLAEFEKIASDFPVFRVVAPKTP